MHPLAVREGQASLKTSPVIDGKFQQASVIFSALASQRGTEAPCRIFLRDHRRVIGPAANRGTSESGGGVTLVRRELESS